MSGRSGFAFGLVGLLLVLTSCGKPKTAPAAPPPLAAVEVVQVAAPGDPAAIVATGALRRGREMTLSFRIPGVITRLSVDNGDAVRRGQVIATLDPADVDARMHQAAADLDRAKHDVARYAQLAERGFVSVQRDEAQRAQLAGAQAAYDAAAFDRRWASLSAPTSGVVLARTAQAGEVVQAGQPVVSLADEASPLVLRAALSDREVARVRMGAPASVTLDSLPGETLSGRVSRIGQLGGPQSGTVEIEITLPERPGLRSGLIASAHIAGAAAAVSAAGFARIPAEAVLEVNGARGFVMRLDPATMTVRRTAVSFGGFDGDDALVSGLAPATRVVTAGAGYVADGQKVSVSDPASVVAGGRARSQ